MALNATNNTTDADFQPWVISEHAKVILYILYILIFLLGTIGNIFVIYFIGYVRRRANPGDHLIVALAATDFLASIAIPFVMVNDLASNLEWHFGEFACKLLPSLNGLLLMGSAWILVAISVERMRAICWPFKKRLTKRFITTGVCIIYACSAVAISPYTYHLTVVNRGGPICWDLWPTFFESFRFFLAFNILFSVLPSIIIFFTYGYSLLQLHKQTRLHSRNKRRVMQDRHVTRMFLVIFFIFFTLTLPYAVFHTLFMYWTAYDMKYFNDNQDTLMSLNYAIFTASAFNSCVNPLIYAKMHRRMSPRLKRIWGSVTSIRHSERRASSYPFLSEKSIRRDSSSRKAAENDVFVIEYDCAGFQAQDSVFV